MKTTPPVRIKTRPLLVSGMLADDADGLLILINSEQPESEQIIALWHETLHLLGMTDEALIETMATKLAAACPEVLRVLVHNINSAQSKEGELLFLASV